MPVPYDNQCGVGRAMNVIGERWTIMILRDLMRKESVRFQDLRDSLAGISPQTLSQRLKSLEANGMVERHLYAEHPPRAEYQLTSKGRALQPALRALRLWGEKYTDAPRI